MILPSFVFVKEQVGGVAPGITSDKTHDCLFALQPSGAFSVTVMICPATGTKMSNEVEEVTPVCVVSMLNAPRSPVKGKVSTPPMEVFSTVMSAAFLFVTTQRTSSPGATLKVII